MNSDTIYALNQRLEAVKTEAIGYIKDVMARAGITNLNLQEIGTGDYPITHSDEEEYALAAVNVDEKGNVRFESESETMMDTSYDGEEDLPAETLVKIAEWFLKNETHIITYSDEN